MSHEKHARWNTRLRARRIQSVDVILLWHLAHCVILFEKIGKKEMGKLTQLEQEDKNILHSSIHSYPNEWEHTFVA